VADAIVEALQHGVVDVWCRSRRSAPTHSGVLLPRRLSEGMARAMKADRVLAGADPNTRRDYELRASRSEPGLPGAEEPSQLAQSTRE